MRFKSVLAMVILLGGAGAGCSFLREKKTPPPPMEYTLSAPYLDVRTLAVAPAINLSGSRDFDPLAVSDALFSEMQQVQGLNVLPLNKTLLAMQRLGIRNIDDPKTAQKLAEMMGADGLVVVAVTAYDPYNPPTVGMVLQMYTPRSTAINADAVQPNTASSTAEASGQQPVSSVNAVFNGGNQSVLRELKGFAAGRADYGSALREKRFLVDSDAYMRFVCHAMVRRLMDVERSRVADR